MNSSMKSTKMIDEITIPLSFDLSQHKPYCMIIYSTHEPHINVVIDCIETVMKKTEFQVHRLETSLKSEDSQFEELFELLKKCSFAIVIFDGLRPNVLFEYGVLKGLNKPCIVLMEENATVDIIHYFDNYHNNLENPLINYDKHLSDIKDKHVKPYNKNEPKSIRKLIQTEYENKEIEINNETTNLLFPNKSHFEKEIEHHLSLISNISKKEINELTPDIYEQFENAVNSVNEISSKYKINPSKRYINVICEIYRKYKKLNIALAILNEEIKDTEHDINLISLKAFIYADLNDFDNAIQTIKTAITLFPHLEPNWHNQGIILERNGQKEEALISYNKGIKLNNNCARLLFSTAILYYEKDDYDKSLELLDKAIDIEPTNDIYLLWKSRSLYKLKKLDKAIITIQDALSFNSNNPEIWFTYSKIIDDDITSLSYLEKALSIDPTFCGALCSKAAILANQDNNEEAIKILSTIDDVCHNIDSCKTIRLNKGKILMNLEKYDEALPYIEEVINIDSDPHAIAIKALILHHQGNVSTGKKLLSEALLQDKENPSLWYNMACFFALSNDVENSIKHLRKAIELNPDFLNDITNDNDFDNIRNDVKFKNEFETS